MRILIAWELGDGYGHILCLLPIIARLQARGHALLFVGTDLSIAAPLLRGVGCASAQAPLPRMHKLQREIASFADILAVHGFADREALSTLLRSWQRIYDQFQPRVVIVNHAPAALFAARLTRIPTVTVGTGFELPPPPSPYPCFRPWLNLPESVLRETEERLLSNLNHICRAQRQPALAALSDLMRADAQFLLTFGETDHYQERDDARYFGPLFSGDQGLDVAWPSGKRTKVFVYLRRSSGHLVSILDRLRQADAQVICVVPGIEPALAAEYQRAAFQVFHTAVKLDPLLSDCDLAITHGGHGTLSAFLLSGTPLLLIPTQIEQMLLSKRVQRAGIGLALSPSEVAAHFDGALKRMLSGSEFTWRAKALATNYADYDQQKTLECIISAIEELPARQV